MIKDKLFIMVLLPVYLFSLHTAMATNSSYVGLSNQIARKHQLGVVAHNAANNGTIGFGFCRFNE